MLNENRVEKHLEKSGDIVKPLNWCPQGRSLRCNSHGVQLTKVPQSTMRSSPTERFLVVHNENGKGEVPFQGKVLWWTGVQHAADTRTS